MLRIIYWIMFCLTSLSVVGQNVVGSVYDNQNNPITGAYVYWLNSEVSTTTDENGAFNIPLPQSGSGRLVAGFIGFHPDTISSSGESEINFYLKLETVLNDVTLVEKRAGVQITHLTARKIEQINQEELTKAACCDLAGCFETQNSVQPQTTNALTNSRELRLLGLNGVYNQVLIDGLPMIEGMSYTYGISSFPGIAIQGISISKGANSVLQGHESISGQLNVQLADPERATPMIINGYVNSFGEQQYNAQWLIAKNDWSNLSSIHLVRPANRIDRNGDDFMDVANTQRLAILNKWKYGNTNNWGWNTEINARWLQESRTGGQMNYRPHRDTGSTSVYGQFVQIQQPELWGKTRYKFNNKNEFSLFYSGYAHYQKSYFGNVHYQGRQWSSNNRFQYDKKYKKHALAAGVSYRYFKTLEDISIPNDTLRSYAGNYIRQEHVVGAFAENTLNFMENRLSIMTGLRLDQHSNIGPKITPRAFVKYNIDEKSTLRASAGKGWRIANVFSENIQMLAGSRDIIFTEELAPEEAWNFGVNATRDFEIGNASGYITADYYYTHFENQIFPDYQSSSSEIILENFRDGSSSHAFQLDLNVTFYKHLELKLGYNYLDMFRWVENEKQQLTFTARHRWMTALSYTSTNELWQLDLNFRYTGSQKLPNTSNLPTEYQRADFSEPFILGNFQVTRSWKTFDLYAGCENFTGFVQTNPIIAADEPFSQFFDTSSVWGPIRGREFYVGFRYKP